MAVQLPLGTSVPRDQTAVCSGTKRPSLTPGLRIPGPPECWPMLVSRGGDGRPQCAGGRWKASRTPKLVLRGEDSHDGAWSTLRSSETSGSLPQKEECMMRGSEGRSSGEWRVGLLGRRQGSPEMRPAPPRGPAGSALGAVRVHVCPLP